MARDEVLSAIESGVDFEKRIADIYQRCRKHEEIKVAFDQLQLELSLEINEAMTKTRRKLLENFDDEVREKLKIRASDSTASLNRLEQWLKWNKSRARAAPPKRWNNKPPRSKAN